MDANYILVNPSEKTVLKEISQDAPLMSTDRSEARRFTLESAGRIMAAYRDDGFEVMIDLADEEEGD